MNHIFIPNLTLHVVARNQKTQDQLTLHYRVINNDLGYRWVNLIDQNNNLNHNLRFNYRRYFNEEDITEQFIEFQNNINFINDNYDRTLPKLVTFDELYSNQEVLNDLHEEYEIYGDRLEELLSLDYFSNPEEKPEMANNVWPGRVHNKDVHEAFLRLNEQIHNFECICRAKETGQPETCSCLVDFIPAGLHEPLKPEDYFLFSGEREWGWGFLGYNTLGKNWHAICWDNDIECIKRDQVRPQERFAAEFYMNFNKPNIYDSNLKFYKWWTDNNLSTITDPDLKLKDFAFGYIPVAKLAGYQINNSSFIGREQIKSYLEWNKDVWSKFNLIEELKVIKQ